MEKVQSDRSHEVAMQYRQYGSTGKEVSVLGFGGMRLPKEDDEAYRLVRAAIDQGINYYDTAPSYCNWRSERIIGSAVRDSGKEVYIADKSMVDYDPTADALRKRLEESLKIMQLEKFTFYQMWDVSSWEKFERVMRKGGPYEGAVQAQKEGLIEHIAISSHADGDVIAKIVETGSFEGITLGYNILNAHYRYAGLDAARAKGMGIATMNPMGGGVLSLMQQCPAAAALQFVMMTPGVSVVLSGMSTPQELRENVSAAAGNLPCDQERIAEIRKLFHPLQDEFCTFCWYCLPCPQKIPIPHYLSAWNILRLNHEDTVRAYIAENIVPLKNMSGLAGDCIACGQCESRCTQKLKVMSLLKELGEQFDAFIKTARA